MRMILYYVCRCYSAVKTININPNMAYSITGQMAVGLGFRHNDIKQYSPIIMAVIPHPSIDAFVAATNPTHLTASGWGYVQVVPYSSQIYAHVIVLAIAP